MKNKSVLRLRLYTTTDNVSVKEYSLFFWGISDRFFLSKTNFAIFQGKI